ncbi:transporter substrate-binding domain-containing protein [Nonomuraea turkmeniaca]|nr:transporter substrate-binding domain-containing protein [Nonomuraea turkmeniaca]
MVNEVDPAARPRRRKGTGRKFSVTAVATGVLGLVLALAAPNVYARVTTPSKRELLEKAKFLGPEKQTLKIGVRDDLPGIANSKDGSLEGFDADIAYAIGEYLEFTRDKVELHPVKIQERQGMHIYRDDQHINLDLVIAAYSITNDRKKDGVRFSYPYFMTKQAAMTRGDYPDTVQSLSDLKGKEVCTLPSSTAFDALRKVGIHPIGRDRISECIKGLKAGKFAAVQSDAAVLAGLVAEDMENLKLHNIGVDFTEKWGVSVRPARAETDHVLDLVNAALYKIVSDGTWDKLFNQHFGATQQRLGGSVIIAHNEPPGIPAPAIRDYE